MTLIVVATTSATEVNKLMLNNNSSNLVADCIDMIELWHMFDVLRDLSPNASWTLWHPIKHVQIPDPLNVLLLTATPWVCPLSFLLRMSSKQ